MEYLFASCGKIKSRLGSRRVALFLDYDGTLTPIVRTPERAVISAKNRAVLRKLTGCAACKVAIISGRSLEDVKKLVGVKGIVYSGNHGFEIEGPKIKFQRPLPAGYKTNLERIKKDLTSKLARVKGAFVEDKGATLSLHYRLADKKGALLAAAIFKSCVKLYLMRKKVRVTSGKKVFEIRPPAQWNKGRIVLWLLAREYFLQPPRLNMNRGGCKGRPVAVYIGDDTTDEDAFKALKGKGLTIFVGRPGASCADYYLKDTKEVYRFLRKIPRLAKEKSACQN